MIQGQTITVSLESGAPFDLTGVNCVSTAGGEMEIASGANSRTETVAGLVSVNWVIGIASFTIKAIGPIAIDDIVIGNNSSGGSGSVGGGNDGGNQGKKDDKAIYCHNNGEISASKNSAHADHGDEY